MITFIAAGRGAGAAYPGQTGNVRQGRLQDLVRVTTPESHDLREARGNGAITRGGRQGNIPVLGNFGVRGDKEHTDCDHWC